MSPLRIGVKENFEHEEAGESTCYMKIIQIARDYEKAIKFQWLNFESVACRDRLIECNEVN